MESERIFREMLLEMNKCLQCDVMQVANGNLDIHLPKFPINNLLSLIFEVKKIFQNEPMVLDVSSPIVVIGDLHGHFLDLVRILQIYGLPIKKQILFLGDFVDRGEFSIETIVYIYLLKYHFPDNVKIIRGNHEFENICSSSGFLNEIKCFYADPELFYAFMESFSFFPIAAVIDNAILAVHGGIGPSLSTIDQIKELQRPLVDFGDELVDNLLWSDPASSINSLGINTLDSVNTKPDGSPKASESSSLPGILPPLDGSDFPVSPPLSKVPSPFSDANNASSPTPNDGEQIEGFLPSKRGSGHLFGKNVLKAFLDANHLTKLIRGHECVQDGTLEAFDGLIITVFSASNYCGTVGNKAAALTIKDRNTFVVKRFPPIPYFHRADAMFPTSEPRKMTRPRASTLSRVTNSSRTPTNALASANEGIKVETIKSDGSVSSRTTVQAKPNPNQKNNKQNQNDTSSNAGANDSDQDPNKMKKRKPCSYSQLRMKAKSSRIAPAPVVTTNHAEPQHKPNPIQVSIVPNKNKKTLSPIFPHPPSNAIISPTSAVPSSVPFPKPLQQMRTGSGIIMKTNQVQKKLPIRESPPPKAMKKKAVLCPPMT